MAIRGTAQPGLPIVLKKPANACSPSRGFRRASGRARGRPTPLSLYMRSSNNALRPKRCCLRLIPPPLFWALLASSQITMRKIDEWQTLATPPSTDRPLDFAARPDKQINLIPTGDRAAQIPTSIPPLPLDAPASIAAGMQDCLD